MLRIGQYGGRRIIAKAQCSSAIIPSPATHRFISTSHSRNHNIGWTPTASWFLGAGVVFTGVSLVIQSPSLGLTGRVVQNESSNSDGNKSTSLGARLASYFIKKPQPIDQKDIVLDTDLTVTSWKQLEQTGLVKVPGVMLWGSNKNGLIDPSGKSPGVIQIPQRLPSFQGTVLRDLKLGDNVAAAVDDQGNVYQWGSGYSSEAHQPEVTLRNRNIASVTLCETKLFGLSKDGTRVYVMPKTRPATGPAKAAVEYEPPKGSAWRYVGLGGKAEDRHDPMIQLPIKDILHKDEIITSFASGKNHLLMVTSEGRVLSSEDGLSVSQIGDTDFRQSRILEGAYSHANLKLAQPTLVKDISGTAGGAECVKVAAGGNTSYVVINEQNRFKVKSAGMGQWGQLGDGTFTHIQGSLVTISGLSNLSEYKEAEKKLMPIGIHDLAIGSTHAFAVLDNAIIENTTSNKDFVSHGYDVLAWGQNTYFQLLTGKRVNRTEPVYALPLDSDILQPADKAIAAISQNSALRKDTEGKEASAGLNPTNRLQLLPVQPRADKQKQTDVAVGKKDTNNSGNSSKGSDEMVELKVVAGDGVSAPKQDIRPSSCRNDCWQTRESLMCRRIPNRFPTPGINPNANQQNIVQGKQIDAVGNPIDTLLHMIPDVQVLSDDNMPDDNAEEEEEEEDEDEDENNGASEL
ncbi:hypothetical protein BGX27_005194 [Mortierella sp. AM989]|nr:hypothetical protein BGX27_005194 [Mortierella sp. AM989]